ncbi:hypothetical protein O181_064356 [Austropuccinia psidii MF-1]|uniref:Alcohol dehydrogenase-like N-terminal domain-containing protein n=1 Tax=Austropuccinia psidii MF-1 TaxID=1389203 RepID=A0A9Q3ELT7_9BASI|nr:hypothetical protein [Austropuccinia psidii MF-1]
MYRNTKPVNCVEFYPNTLTISTSSLSNPPDLSSREVLVEVLAVALDQWDLHLLCSLGASSRTTIRSARDLARRQKQPHPQGIVPGRSFFGKILEVGRAVKRVKRGDLVYGLQDLSKAGALSARIKISSDFVAKAPLNCGKTLRRHSGVFNSECSYSMKASTDVWSEFCSPPQLSSIEIACLPILAVPAALIAGSVCQELPKGSKILILNGHKGIGRMILQLMQYFRPNRDLWISVHVPQTAGANLVDSEHLSERLVTEGATEVIISESVLRLFHSQHESSFDMVLDTIGGQRIYDGSRRILHHSGMFVSTVGPSSTTSLSPSRFFRLRSLKRQFFKKDTKLIRYWQVTPAERYDGAQPEEIRTVLEALSDWLSEPDDTKEQSDEFQFFPGLCWPVIGSVIEGLEHSMEFLLESLAVSTSDSNLFPEAKDYYEDSRLLKFGNLAVVVINS